MTLDHASSASIGDAKTNLFLFGALAEAWVALRVDVFALRLFHFLSDCSKFVQLLGLRDARIDHEVGVADHHLVLPGLLNSSLLLGHFLDHVVTRNEDSIEECRVSEGLVGRVDLRLEVNFALVSRSVYFGFHLSSLVFFLHSVTVL